MEESGESWNYAVPPPAEFSTYGPAVPPPAEFSEGQSPIFNQSNNGVPVTNIDEIIQSYRQSPTVHNQENYIPQSRVDDAEEPIRQMESLTGLQRDESDSLDNSLTYFDENLPDEEGLDVIDSYQEDNAINQFVQGDEDVDAVDAEPFIPPAPVNIEDIDVHSNEDDEFVIPVTVQRQKHIPFTSAVTVSSVSPTEIEEDQIIPSVEHRKRVPASATIKLEERKHQEPPPKPVPQPRVKPTVINVERSPAPKISSMSDERGVEEEMVRAEFKERQSGNEKFREKLGGEVEEEIVAVEVKRDQSWNAAKLAVITNMWSKSARKNNEREEDSEKTNLKSVINVMNSKKKQDVKEAGDLSKKDEIEIVKEETYSKTDPREQSVHKNVIEVSAPVRMDDAKLENKAEKMESVSPTTDKQTVRVEPVNTEIAKQTVTVNNTVVDSKPTETEHAPLTSATKTEVQAPAPAVISKAAEENVPSTTPAKSTPAPSPSPFKSSIAITKPSSLLSTIRSQNSSSATLKPLSSIKPVTVSAKTFSLGKPAGLSGSLLSGRTSLLSTIHGTSTSAKSTRSEEEPFLVSVLKGILGLGMKVSLTPEGCVRVDEIQSSGPIAKDGNIRVGDYLLSINNTELTGLPDAKIQQILRLLPRGIAKILVSVKPPSTDGVARPTELNLSTNESAVSKHSPLSSPRTMSRPASVSPALSPRQHTSSSLQPSSPRQPVMEKSIAPAEESTVKVTVNHDQYAPETKKVPPPVAPKPKHSSPPDHVSKTGSLRGSGGYVSSAVGRTNSFGKREPQTVDVRPHIQPKKADYVSSARKMVPEKEEKEPIDTVVFASVDFNKMNAVSRQTMGQPKPKHVPEPQMITKGHVDYVSSAKPKVSSPTTTSPRAKDIPQSPYAYEDVSTKISPVKLNSALSPRRKNEDKFTYGVSLTGNRVKGKEGEQHITDSPLSSPKSPVTSTLHSPNIVTPSVKSESEFTASPEVHPEPVSSPQGSTPDGGQEDTVPETLQQDTTPDVESSNQSAVESSNPSAVESTDEVNVEQPCEHSTDQPNITDPFQNTKNVDNISESLCTEVDIVSTTEPLVDTAIALTNDSAQNDNVVISQKDDPINGENKIDVEILKGDSDPEDIKDMADDVDSELFVKFVEDIVRGAIQKGLDEFKTSEADGKMADHDEEGKTVADEMSPVHDSHPRAVMETKSLRAFLQKLDSSEKEMPLPDSYSLNQNPVAEKIAIEMLKTLEEDGDSHSRHTNSATKQSANTTKSLLTNTNNGEQVDQCMSIPHPASVACNDVVLDTPSSVSMSVDGVNVSSVDSVGDVTVNALSIQEPKSCTEQQSEAGSHGVGDCVNSDVKMEVCDEDIENIEIVLNDDYLNARVSPINLLGGDCISQTECDVRDYFTISSRRPWSVCIGEHQFSSDSSDVSDIGPSLDRLSPVELENLLNPANDELDSFGFGSDARLVVVLLDTSAREELGLRLSTGQNGPLVVSEVMSGSVADGGHIQVGDKVVSIDGVSTASLTPGAVMNGIDTSISGHLIVLTRVEEDSTDTEAPPTPEAPPPELPVTAPPGVSTPTEEVEARGAVHDSIVMEQSKESETSRQESETSRQEVVDSEPEVLSKDKDKVVKSSEDSNVQESGAELDKLALNDNWTTDSLNVTIPNILEVSSPQGSQDSGLGMPSPLDTPSSLEDSISTEKSKEEEPKVEHSFSNGDLNQALSSPTSTLDSLGPLSSPTSTLDSLGPLSSPSSTLDSLGPLSPAVSDDADNDSAEKETFEVVMNKGVTGLGFLIEGGKASAKGDQPLTIRRIFKGGPAEKCGMLKVKDEILKVNGLEVTEMRHSEAWTHLKFLDEGPVYLLIRRKVQPAED